MCLFLIFNYIYIRFCKKKKNVNHPSAFILFVLSGVNLFAMFACTNSGPGITMLLKVKEDLSYVLIFQDAKNNVIKLIKIKIVSFFL